MNDLRVYKVMPQWDKASLPEAFTRKHNTKEGTWAKLTIIRGSMNFDMMNEAGDVTETLHFTAESEIPFVAPQQWHRIASFSDDLQCQLAFYCTPEDYFAKKYQLTATHSEVVEAVQRIPAGKALDLGCGGGRNALYLSIKGFDVTAWDRNESGIETMLELARQENLSHFQGQVKDLNSDTFSGSYDFILSTVVLMFLNRERIPSLIHTMQECTAPGGYNLIVAAMDSEDYPCQIPFFSFTFKPGELKAYYPEWEIVKYNENVGALHRTDEQGNRIKLRFATLLARKPGGR